MTAENAGRGHGKTRETATPPAVSLASTAAAAGQLSRLITFGGHLIGGNVGRMMVRDAPEYATAIVLAGLGVDWDLASRAPRPRMVELERIRQWCPACGRVTPTLTTGAPMEIKSVCFVCHHGSAEDDDYDGRCSQ